MFGQVALYEFLGLVGRMLPVAAGLSALSFAIGLWLAFAGSPADYQQGETVRIMYIHVPAAWLGLFAYMVMASAALGTVFVERVGDGVVVSLLVVGCFFALKTDASPGWMMPTAYLALAGFTTVMLFLAFALWRPRPTVHFALAMTLLPRFAPKAAAVIEEKVLELIRGFAVLHDHKNLAAFIAWSAVYWIANGLATWLLARGLGLPLSLTGAFATMGLVAVGISLPNSPGLVDRKSVV